MHKKTLKIILYSIVLSFVITLLVLAYQWLTRYYNSSEIQSIAFNIFGGLGIFLFGIHIMSDSLKLLAGKRLKVMIEKTTKYPIYGILIGILITGLIQSSSGTTALTVGLVRAGLMTLPQAVGIIIGANIGTTITSFLIGLKIKNYALPIIAVGSFLIFFAKSKKWKHVGGSTLGFGLLFFGLGTMESSLKALVSLPSFVQLFVQFGDTPILGVFVGSLATMAVQSSSATVGLIQSLYSTGAIPIMGAIALVFGSNIGTTITAILASIGGSVASKRAALAHVIFNILGAFIFIVLIVPYTSFIVFLENRFLNGEPVEMTISFAHMGFNIVNTLLMMWFVKQLVWIVTKLIPGNDIIVQNDMTMMLNPALISESTSIALEASRNAIISMGDITVKMLEDVIDYSFQEKKERLENGFMLEELLDTFDHKIHDYLVKISTNDLSEKESSMQAECVDTIRDLERIGDHCTNLLQFFEQRHENKISLNDEASLELKVLYLKAKTVLELALKAFQTQDKDIAKQVKKLEDEIDTLVLTYRKRHIKRLNDHTIDETKDSFYVDILSNIERIGDHCNNIAINVIQDHYYNEPNDQ